METFVAVVAFLAGLNIGSFLNVVIWRLPRGEMTARRRSHCPACGALIPWHDNVPLLSWVALRGRCRACAEPIGVRYPLVEALTGCLFLAAALAHPVELVTAAIVAVHLAALVAITFIDLDHRIIPDRITKPGMALFVALAPLSTLHQGPFVSGVKPALSAWLHAGAGLAVGAGVVLAIRAVGSWILRKEAMGLGDVKLLGLIGAVVGPLQVLYALALGCLAGAVIGGLMFAVGKRRPMGCRLAVRGGGLDATYSRARVRGGRIEVAAQAGVAAGTELRLVLTLPAVRILEDEDATLSLRARAAEGPAGTLLLDVLEPTAEDRERLEMFASSYRYIPFGPFLALGGAITALYAGPVHWFMTEGYPRFARSLM